MEPEQQKDRLAEWITSAKLSPREFTVLMHWLEGTSDNTALGRLLGMKASTVSVHKSAIRRKLLVALEEARAAERLMAEMNRDEAAIEGQRAFYGFLLTAMRGVHNPNPRGQLIGAVWTDSSGATMGEVVRIRGDVVTVDDLMRKGDRNVGR